MSKVSVIVPVYNVEEYLPKCLDSIINQTLKDIEIILVDDGSEDNSGKICDEYAEKDSRIIVIHQKNQGQSKARNTGLNIASGEYIGFVDSDDYIKSEMYSEMYQTAEKTDSDIVSCNYSYDSNENITENKKLFMPENKCINKDEIKEIILFAHKNKTLWFTWKCIYKKELLTKNYIKFIENTIEDAIFNLECLCCADNIYFLNKPFYYYVNRQGSIINTPYKNDFLLKLNNQYNEKLKIYKKYNITGFEKDLYYNNISHTLPMLISNEINHKCSLNEKIKELKEIRNSELVCDTFKNISPFVLKTNIKYIIILLKLRQYFLLSLILK